MKDDNEKVLSTAEESDAGQDSYGKNTKFYQHEKRAGLKLNELTNLPDVDPSDPTPRVLVNQPGPGNSGWVISIRGTIDEAVACVMSLDATIHKVTAGQCHCVEAVLETLNQQMQEKQYMSVREVLAKAGGGL